MPETITSTPNKTTSHRGPLPWFAVGAGPTARRCADGKGGLAVAARVAGSGAGGMTVSARGADRSSGCSLFRNPQIRWNITQGGWDEQASTGVEVRASSPQSSAEENKLAARPPRTG